MSILEVMNRRLDAVETMVTRRADRLYKLEEAVDAANARIEEIALRTANDTAVLTRRWDAHDGRLDEQKKINEQMKHDFTMAMPTQLADRIEEIALRTANDTEVLTKRVDNQTTINKELRQAQSELRVEAATKVDQLRAQFYNQTAINKDLRASISVLESELKQGEYPEQAPAKPIPAWVCDVVGTFFVERMHSEDDVCTVNLARMHTSLTPMPRWWADGPDSMRITIDISTWPAWIKRLREHTPLIMTLREAKDAKP